MDRAFLSDLQEELNAVELYVVRSVVFMSKERMIVSLTKDTLALRLSIATLTPFTVFIFLTPKRAAATRMRLHRTS